jgi:hypothetical protein
VHAMKAFGGGGSGGEWWTSCPGHFIPRGTSPSIPLRVWVGPRASLDELEKTKIICPSQESNYDPWTVQTV